MKTIKIYFILLSLFLVFSFTACKDDGGNGDGDNGNPLTYKIGDTGPGGGKIFYDKGNNSDGWRYLEAAPADVGGSPLSWDRGGLGVYTDITGTGTAIGTGKANTALILQTLISAPAANACKTYSNNGKTDWFLPSRDELGKLCEQRDIVGISSNIYFSSSQESRGWVYCYDFSTGSSANYNKGPERSVRAVRSF
jgi:hypothetical protein